ncbi:MAG: hypothetical protein L3J67_07685 [Hyphomicrobiaceae bacterium]|nr:hypothetical protein [Hyphomicrobiaceae bacterium]
MHVKMLESREITMSSGAKNIKPAGWEGEVPDEIGEDWVNEGVAEFTGGSGEGVAFTPDEKLALKHVAAGVLQNAAEQAEITLDDLDRDGLLEVAANIGLEVPSDMDEEALRAALAAHFEAQDGEAVEMVEEEQDDAKETSPEADDELQLADLSYDELVELAQKAGIEKPRSIKKPELLALLSEKAADNSAPNTNTDSEAAE